MKNVKELNKWSRLINQTMLNIKLKWAKFRVKTKVIMVYIFKNRLFYHILKLTFNVVTHID